MLPINLRPLRKVFACSTDGPKEVSSRIQRCRSLENTDLSCGNQKSKEVVSASTIPFGAFDSDQVGSASLRVTVNAVRRGAVGGSAAIPLAGLENRHRQSNRGR